ncbi:CCR4-NOT transcription complex subunit 10-like [Watersipora subatra]|uniref:CCR4-NOT transcription complex subunit 10-like n=1 Tax=Watersipora subatra TaxID=2589382 RepID=UPI00355BB066
MADDNSSAAADDHSDSLPAIPAVTEQEKEMGSMAAIEFDKRQLDGCAKILDKLMSSRAGDSKVIHNKSVIDYYQSGLRTTDDFLASLIKVCELAQVSMTDIDSLDDVDQCIVYYNQAVIYYHTRRYGNALAITEKLYTFLEPLDESLSKRVMCLLAELYLCTSQPDRAIAIINSLEKIVFPRKEGEESSSETSLSDRQIENWKLKLALYKVQSLMMSRAMKHCKRELKNLNNSTGEPCSAYMKANYEYLRGNLEKAMRILNSITPATSPKRLVDTSSVLFYNNLACIHMMMRKHYLGSFYFKKALTENENLAKELKLETLGHGISGKPLFSLPMSRHFELLYNTGIQLLHCSQPVAAFDCLVEAVKVYSSNPRLWLRLAECCVMANKKDNDEDRKLEKRLQVVQGVIGAGINRKLIIGTGKGDFRPCTESAAMPGATLEFAALCLSNALLLLNTAEQQATQKLKEELGDTPAGNIHERILVAAPPSLPMKADEVAQLRCSILANSAYISLLLHDYTMALQHSEALLAQDNLSPAHKYLAHMYMAEAQLYLDRIADAIRNLNAENVADISVSLVDEKSEQDKEQAEGGELQANLHLWIPSDIPKARAYMQYNLAVCYATRGEYDKAMATLALCTQHIGTPLPVHVYFLRLYLDLLEGRRKIAQGIIKEHFGHVTPNRV